MRALAASFVSLLCIPAPNWSSAQEKEPLGHPLVATQEGKLPIILSAPHGGLAAIPGVPERTGEGLPKGPSGFFTGRDVGTEQLAYALAAAIEAKMGKKPYLVAAKFHRKYTDANRPPEIAFEHPKAKVVYAAYHDTLARYCRNVRNTYGRGLLLDLHGQGTAKDTVFRGTKDGKTVTLLIERFGEKAHNGPRSFFGLMAREGMKIHPEDGGKERAGFTGGYIVQTYGSHKGFKIDAIQLEFGGDYRAKDKVKDTAARVAAVVANFAKLYLEGELPKKQDASCVMATAFQAAEAPPVPLVSSVPRLSPEQVLPIACALQDCRCLPARPPHARPGAFPSE